ncbi:class I adenylate-forming enzyme family protein [Streptacidiphilus jiangxiensis]|uniref:Acyl-CoA synthetase (AMP-forming)/AMP-acid ligase II n=1 Tax=Streptacidiphilus jiangxiensis TaxID=235985 RepID=A0A1H7FZI3_STRJI|nr:AMP-binding protein [Streptacidiphilus jiangxiensis]SEK31318.1 Acyl-CoA synthetase (AMP-forming)/AMP-acid ligase II [Streptacidiphilus jiangxiensis]
MSPTLCELLRVRAREEPERQALVVAGVGALDFGEWVRRADAVAAGLLRQGVAPGDRVALVFGNGEWLDYAVAFLGVLTAGAVAVPLFDQLAAADLDVRIRDSGASVVLRAGTLPAAEPDNATDAARPTPAAGDLAQILYTSGTTGRPKGVGATHANLAYGWGGRRRPFAHSRHLAHGFPIGTNAGQWMLANAIGAHPTVVTLPRFTPGRFARLIEEHRAGTVFLVPTMAIEMLTAGVHTRADLSSVLLLGSAAAPLPGRVAGELAAAFPRATIANYYTSTEAAPAQTVMLFDPERPASLGRPTSGGAVRIATADGEPAPAGTVGEVWMRSPVAGRSYYGDATATGEVFRGGWVRMGDLGYLDDDGYLFLVDRESDVVKSGAHKVSTLHVEEVVHQHPQVVEAAAFGVAHESLGKAVAVAVVGAVDHADLRGFLKDRLAPHEMPHRLVTLDALPRNHGGKVDKRALREVVQ